MRRKLKSLNLIALLVSPYMSGVPVSALRLRRAGLAPTIPYGVIIRSAYYTGGAH